MTFEVLGTSALDYLTCRYGTSKLLFRGPRRKLEGKYCAFVGGTETYGKFIADPFPGLIERYTGLKCVNFGCPNAGIDVFLNDPVVPGAASSAQVSIVQVMGAQNLTNRFYKVHPRRNDRFLKASQLLRSIYSEVDFSEFHFNKHMLKSLMTRSPERFAVVRHELQQAWQARMSMLLSRIGGQIILFWFARHRPEQDVSIPGFGADPMFLTREMIEFLRPKVTDIVEVVASPEAQGLGTEGMVFSQMEAPAAGYIMGPVAHEEAARALAPVIKNLS